MKACITYPMKFWIQNGISNQCVALWPLIIFFVLLWLESKFIKGKIKWHIKKKNDNILKHFTGVFHQAWVYNNLYALVTTRYPWEDGVHRTVHRSYHPKCHLEIVKCPNAKHFIWNLKWVSGLLIMQSSFFIDHFS